MQVDCEMEVGVEEVLVVEAVQWEQEDSSVKQPKGNQRQLVL